MKSVVWTAEAKIRLREIQTYIGEHDPKAAQQVVRRLLEQSKTLGDLPLSGRQVPEFRQDDLRELLVRPYRLIYRVRDEQVQILTVKHYRQRLPKHANRLSDRH